MSKFFLNSEPQGIGGGNDSVVIVRCLDMLPAGACVKMPVGDVADKDLIPRYIYAGTPIYRKEDDGQLFFMSLLDPETGEPAVEALNEEGASLLGVVASTSEVQLVKTGELSFAVANVSIMTAGSLNLAAAGLKIVSTSEDAIAEIKDKFTIIDKFDYSIQI